MPSEPLLLASLQISVPAAALALVLLLLTFTAHHSQQQRDHRARQLRQTWQRVFFHSLVDLPRAAPPLAPRDAPVVLKLWLEVIESVRGQGHRTLSMQAADLGFERHALKWLDARATHRRMLGAAVLGRMGLSGAFGPMEHLLDDRDPVLSLMAARSLLMIDAERALPLVLPRIALRHDWSLIRIAAMLSDVPTEVLHPLFRVALQDHRSGAAVRLLRLIQPARIEASADMLRRFLYLMQPADVLEAALQVCHHPTLVPAIRELLRHPATRVRREATAAWGRLGGLHDTLSLGQRLLDPAWSVRRQAALALLRMPGLQPLQLQALEKALANAGASAMLAQAQAELRSGVVP
jgi:HEAT repeat protein